MNEKLTIWAKEFLFLALIVTVSGVVGYLYESPLLGVVSGAVLLLALHFAQVFALSRTLSQAATAGSKSHLVLSPIGRFLQKEIRNLFALQTDQAASIEENGVKDMISQIKVMQSAIGEEKIGYIFEEEYPIAKKLRYWD